MCGDGDGEASNCAAMRIVEVEGYVDDKGDASNRTASVEQQKKTDLGAFEAWVTDPTAAGVGGRIYRQQGAAMFR